MEDWWRYLGDKNFELISGFELKDFLYPFALFLWIVLIALPIQDVDRRDDLTGACYAIYCCSTAIVFFLAMPANYMSLSDLPVHIGFVSVFAGISGYRWIRSREAQLALMAELRAKKKREKKENAKK